MPQIIYILKLENNKYYCGKTNKSVQSRFEEHKNKEGSEWTRLYKPIKIISFRTSKSIFDEDNTVKELMMKEGIFNVRGGSYSNTKLSSDQIKLLETEFRSAKDICFRCGSHDHFVNDCSETNTYSSEEESSFDDDLPLLRLQKKQRYTNYLDDVQCYKCEEYGHYANDCDNGHIRCYCCDQMGHYATECPNRL